MNHHGWIPLFEERDSLEDGTYILVGIRDDSDAGGHNEVLL
jgi:hypothetical protein